MRMIGHHHGGAQGRLGLCSLATGLVLLGLVPLGVADAGERARRPALRASLREQATYRVDDEVVRGRAHLRFAARLDRLTATSEPGTSGRDASALDLRFGDLDLSVPLDRGRHRGVLTGTDLRVNVRLRGRRLRVSVRARRGAVYGVRALIVGDRVGGPVYALETGAFALDDDPETVFAIGAHGRLDAVRGVRGKLRDRVRMRAAAMLPGDAGAAPLVALIPDRAGSPWGGRVRGHVLSQGEAPLVTWRLDDGTDALVSPLDAEALDIGATERRRVGDGVAALDFDSATVAQTRFDFAVPAGEGEHKLALRVADAAGARGRARRWFNVDAPRRPTLLDAGLQVLESRGGALWAWGENGAGEVGDGTRRTPLSPVPLDAPSGVVAVAAGGDFSLAVGGSGGVWQWGEWERTREVQTGVFETSFIGSKVPVRHDDLSDIVAVAGGEDHALALDAAGRVFAWGDNTSGQLGDGLTTSRARRKRAVQGLPEITAIAATDAGSLGLDRDGVVWTWGDSGLAGVADPSIPETVLGLPPIRAIDARGVVLCLAEDGSVWTWGENSDGELGDGTTLDRPVPGLVLGLRRIVQVSAGDFHSLALRDDGRVLAWGDNGSGELGDGTSMQRSVPVLVRDLQDVTLIAAGTFSSYAVTADGAVWGWGTVTWDDGPVGDGGTYPGLAKRAFEPGHVPKDASGAFFQFKR